MNTRIHHGIYSILALGLFLFSPMASAFTIIQLLNDVDDLDIVPQISPSTLITDVDTVDTNVKSVSNGVSNRVNNAFRKPSIPAIPISGNILAKPKQGMSAGDPQHGIGVWANYGYTDYENDFSATEFDGRTHTGLIGIDFMPTSNTIVGVALGYENSETDTTFNIGDVESNGYTVAPYVGIALNDYISADASFGFSKIENEQSMSFFTLLTESDFDSKRWFATGNLNGFYPVNNWLLSGQFGVLWAKNEQEQYQETFVVLGTPVTRTVAARDSELKQFYLSAEAAYSMNQFEPYARVSYVRDFSRTRLQLDPSLPQPSDDKDDFLVGGGLRMFAKNGFSGNLEYSKRLGRDDFDEDIVSFLIRMDL